MQIKINRRFLILFLFLFVIYLIYIIVFGIANRPFNNFINSKQSGVETYRDWNDYKYLAYEETRIGPGERGEAVTLAEPEEIKLNQESIERTGFSVLVSDKISVNRTIPKFVHPDCLYKKYFADLPKTSVIIIFYNEVLSVLLRTVHSVYNRTPKELLHEIILVNDDSTEEELGETLRNYLNENFPRNLIKIKKLPTRSGLIVARMEGARTATGEVLVFFDSHIEVQNNWLPPLLQPIAENRKLATMPIPDYFDCRTFEHYPGQGENQGFRGVIDWHLNYYELPKLKDDLENPIRPFPNPIMLGCGFAIDRKYFVEELGGYDEEMKIWNGENYELSFKLWMCRDGLFTVPCSRISHSFRDINPSRKNKEDFVARNFKRLAEVWLDEFKTLLYQREPNRFNNLDPGDLTKPKQIRERLECKSYRWFLKNIAPDMVAAYPPINYDQVFASGAIQSVANPRMCLDNLGKLFDERIGIYECSNDLTEPGNNQNFRFTFFKDLRQNVDQHSYCLDAYNLNLYECNEVETGNQVWNYKRETQELLRIPDNRPDASDCITIDLQNSTINLKECNGDINQKWIFAYVNHTAYEKFDETFGYKGMISADDL
ncbi:unnamed protein product [Chironomus riparius]|uniref:Polypeptide N-acetylgalactosaminyltransferase n=1 Tax=Chironomus riparius TaxID=315576 RepID=A0A9N9S7Y1_9DIPT|nr:unnamed protein product [Chironomus riparius]